MVFEGVKCGDCGKLVSRNIHINESGVPFWECPACGVYHEDWNWYKYISEEQYEQMLDTLDAGRNTFGGQAEPRGLFVLDTGIEVIGIDNRTGDMWVEEFPDMEECLNWLVGDKEVSE